MMKKFTTVFCGFFFVFSAFAQGDYATDTTKLTKNQLIEIGNRYYNEAEFYTAANFYRKALDKYPDNPQASFGLALSLVFARDYKGAEKAFKDFYSSGGEYQINYPEGQFYYGTVLHRLGKYKEAKSQLSDFIAAYNPETSPDGQFFLEEANVIIRSCDEVKSIPKAKISIDRMPKGINRAYNDYAPSIYNDKVIYFTSTQADSVKKTLRETYRLPVRIYKATMRNGKWGKAETVSAWVNDRDYVNCDGKFNKDKTRFYFTRCIERENGTALCNLYYSAVEKGKGLSWPMRLPDNVNHPEKYSSSQATVRATTNKDEEFIYYVSDRPGGKGGNDIWVCYRTEWDSIREPQLLDAEGVNTIGDEQSPYFDDSTQTLYFASNGHIGFGGFDIYKTTLSKDGKWSKVENLGKPINSGADDMYYVVARNQNYGYFSSNREGSIPLNGIATASDDIFLWEPFHYPVFGKSTWKETGDTLTATYHLYKINAFGERELIAVDSLNNRSYSFKMNPDLDYEIEVEKPFFEPKTARISTHKLSEEDTLKQDFVLEKNAITIEGELFDAKYPKMKVNGSATILRFVVNDDKSKKLYSQSSIVGKKINNYSIKAPLHQNVIVEVHKEGYFANSGTVSTKDLDVKTDTIRLDLLVKKMVLKGEQ